MVSQVLAEVVAHGLLHEAKEVEGEPETGQIEVANWQYLMPCAGVKYYSYEQEVSPTAELEP